jgi:hypothetical protein
LDSVNEHRTNYTILMSGFSAKGLRHRKGDRETRGRGPKDFSSSRSLGKDGNGLRKNRRKVSTIKDLIFST